MTEQFATKMEFDIIVETKAGLHILLAAVPDQQHGAMVAEALYYHYQNTPPSGLQVKYVWLRDMADPTNPRLLDAWPEHWKNREEWEKSIAAWKASPRGVSGLSPEKEQAAIEQARAQLDKMPANYQPYELTRDERGYSLRISHTNIYQGADALEALERTKRYIAERERSNSGWSLPIGVIDGIYD